MLTLLALRFHRTESDERGATLVEYALLVTLIAIVCFSAVAILGSSVSTQLSSINDPLR